MMAFSILSQFINNLSKKCTAHDIEIMVDTREAFDPGSTAPCTGFQQVETALLILLQKNKMKQLFFLFHAPRSQRSVSSPILFHLNLVTSHRLYLYL